MGKSGKKSKRGQGEIYSEAKTEQIAIRLTPSGKARLKEKAKRFGLSVQQLIEAFANDELG